MVSADDVAGVIVSRSGAPLTAMQLQKLLYYVQSWHLAVTDQPLFTERFKAWADGPVVPQVWHLRKEASSRRSQSCDANETELDTIASNLIDLVLSSYGSRTGDELSALTHAEQPWLDARGNLAPDAKSQTALDEQTMAEFYRSKRRLGGRTAADLAAGGVWSDAAPRTGPIDVDALLAGIVDVDPVDSWGGANLETPTNRGTRSA